VAGVYARTDYRVGVHKAPANALVEGVVDIRAHVDDREQGILNAVGVNCLRALPGRGIRVCGARTLSGRAEWRYVNVRRLVITVRRWLENECLDLVFDPNDSQLWNRIRDRLSSYCFTLYRSGALKGDTPEEAYYVKCDAETNPPAERDDGEVTTEIGLAATRPAEFIVVRITQRAGRGVT
jgi:phage tail sheath protein FI